MRLPNCVKRFANRCVRWMVHECDKVDVLEKRVKSLEHDMDVALNRPFEVDDSELEGIDHIDIGAVFQKVLEKYKDHYGVDNKQIFGEDYERHIHPTDIVYMDVMPLHMRRRSNDNA